MFTYFYHGAIRRSIVAFGTIFKNIDVARYDDNNVELDRIKVPLAYLPKRRYFKLIQQATQKTKNEDQFFPAGTQIQLPRMSFFVTNIDYDAPRKTTTVNKIYNTNDNDSVKYSYPRVPYKLNFEFGIYTKKQEDGLQILEQILPYFTPSLNVSYSSLDGYDFIDDMILNLEDISPEYETDANVTDDLQIYTWTLSFSAQIYLYGAGTTSGLIKTVETTFKNMDTNSNMSRVTVEVDPITSGIDDNYGFSTGIEILG